MKRVPENQSARKEEYAAVVAKACRILETAEETPALKTLAKKVGMSPYHFHRIFRVTAGVTPKAYANACRSRRMRRELSKQGTITEAIYEVGFNSNSRFYEKSSQMLGMTPTSFRNGGKGATIRFAVGECSLGSVLVASSEKGICAISLGDNPEILVQNLQDQFSKAHLIGGNKEFERIVAEVIGFIEAPGSNLKLPLDVRGTVFQQKVWLALQEIPAGSTVSYTDIAQRLGLPKSVRAVARACASNRIAIAIPCHRVVRNDGNISGYRWGVERKCALLGREAKSRA